MVWDVISVKMRLGFDKMRVLVASLLCLVAAGETTITKSGKLPLQLKTLTVVEIEFV